MHDTYLPGYDLWLTREPYDPLPDLEQAAVEEEERLASLSSYDDMPPALQIDPDTGIEITHA